jgi:hypothetical protein
LPSWNPRLEAAMIVSFIIPVERKFLSASESSISQSQGLNVNWPVLVQ